MRLAAQKIKLSHHAELIVYSLHFLEKKAAARLAEEKASKAVEVKNQNGETFIYLVITN